MTRLKRIEELLQKKVKIKYHFGYYTKQRRLIIDQVEDFHYNNSAEDQKMAREYVDLLHGEFTHN